MPSWTTLGALLVLFSVLLPVCWGYEIKVAADFDKWIKSKTGVANFTTDVVVDLKQKTYTITWVRAGLINKGNKRVEIKNGSIRFSNVAGIVIYGIYMHQCTPSTDSGGESGDCIGIEGNSQASISYTTLSRGGDELINCRNVIDTPTEITVSNCLFIHHKNEGGKEYADADKLLSQIGNCQTTITNSVFFNVGRLVSHLDPDGTPSAVEGRESKLVLNNNLLDYPCRPYWFELKNLPHNLTITRNWFHVPSREMFDPEDKVPILSPSNCVSSLHVTSSSFTQDCTGTIPTTWKTLKTTAGANFFKLATLQTAAGETLCGKARRYKKRK